MSLDGELRHRAFELGKRRAVLVRGEIESIRGDKAAGARVVLHDDAGMAGNEAPEMAGDESGGNVVDAARRAADQHGDRASAIEPHDRHLQVTLEQFEDVERAPAGSQHVDGIGALGFEEIAFDMRVNLVTGKLLYLVEGDVDAFHAAYRESGVAEVAGKNHVELGRK